MSWPSWSELDTCIAQDWAPLRHITVVVVSEPCHEQGEQLGAPPHKAWPQGRADNESSQSWHARCMLDPIDLRHAASPARLCFKEVHTKLVIAHDDNGCQTLQACHITGMPLLQVRSAVVAVEPAAYFPTRFARIAWENPSRRIAKTSGHYDFPCDCL